MALEPVERILHKADHWPLTDRRRYLIAALKAEKGRHRRRLIHETLRGITTRVLRQELRGSHE
jgi:hypothetical protein